MQRQTTIAKPEKIERKWYVIDATSDCTVLNNEFELLSYEYFLISEEEMRTSKNQYVGENYTNIECTTNYDPYANFTYDGTHTYKVKSFIELKSIVKAFGEMSSKSKSVQILFDYDFIGSKSNEVSKAYNANLMSSSFSYSENGDIFTIIENK